MMNENNHAYDEDDYTVGDDEDIPPTAADVINIDNEPVFDAELETQARAMKRKLSQRGASFTAEEDVLICESWIEVGTNEIIRAEQRGTAY